VIARHWEGYGITPSLRYTYSANQSNIEGGSSQSHSVTLSVIRRF
jgi:hypothetical protein